MDKLKGWQDAISQMTDTTTNTPEPVATIHSPFNACMFKERCIATQSALQAERERADKAEQNYRFMVEKAADKSLDGYRELASKVLANEIRAEKAEAERDKLRAELAALKEALRNPTPEMIEAGAKVAARFIGSAKDSALHLFYAMTAHLLKD